MPPPGFRALSLYRTDQENFASLPQRLTYGRAGPGPRRAGVIGPYDTVGRAAAVRTRPPVRPCRETSNHG
eukprot:582277-Hanusia_phi.AAC.1